MKTEDNTDLMTHLSRLTGHAANNGYQLLLEFVWPQYSCNQAKVKSLTSRQLPTSEQQLTCLHENRTHHTYHPTQTASKSSS